ncbi:Uncharacterized protein FWK35_00027011, partial [Aphis craccivora]
MDVAECRESALVLIAMLKFGQYQGVSPQLVNLLGSRHLFCALLSHVRVRLPFFTTSCHRSTVKDHVDHPTNYAKPGRLLDSERSEEYSERSEECIDFTMIITSRNNAPISNYGGGFRCKSEYPWCIIE